MLAWRVLQLADSAFPTGGFAHSAGLETALHVGTVRGAGEVAQFVEHAITAAGHGAVPFLVAAWDADDPEKLVAIDSFCTATLWSHVAARASRAQGRALVDVAARAFDIPSLVSLRQNLVLGGPGDLGGSVTGHLAPMFGAVTRALDVARREAAATYLYLTARSLLSAAVRLGAIGPTEAQAIHGRLDPTLDAALALGESLALDDVAQTSPLAELVQAGHDRLYTRLFQS